MLDLVLKFLVGEVNTHLRKRTGSEFGAVTLGPLVDDKGNWVQTTDSLRLTLFQIDEERVLHEPLPEHVLQGTRELILPPTLKLNLIVLFAARFRQYEQGLSHLALLMSFLQARPLFSAAATPGLPAGVDRLSTELVSYTPEQLNQMWACLGAKHLPSVVYRIRTVLLQDQEPLASGAPVSDIRTRVGSR